MSQKINIVLFGIGKAGSSLINKAVKSRKDLAIEEQIELRFPVITNSTVAFFEKEGPKYSWEANFIQFGIPFRLEDVVDYVHANNLSNLVAVDATGDAAFVKEYAGLIKSGFNLISINETLKGGYNDLQKEIARTAINRGLEYNYLAISQSTDAEAADALFEAIIAIAVRAKAVA